MAKKTYTEADIPKNEIFTPKNFDETVSETIRIAVERMKTGIPHKLATIFLYNDEREDMWISEAAALNVVDAFKSRGYYAHWEIDRHGNPYAFTITATPTNKDI